MGINIYGIPMNGNPNPNKAPHKARCCGHETPFAAKLFCDTVYGRRVRLIEVPATNDRLEHENFEVHHEWCHKCLENQTRLCVLCGDAIFVGDYMNGLYFWLERDKSVPAILKDSREFLNPLCLSRVAQEMESHYKTHAHKLWETVICCDCAAITGMPNLNKSVLLPGRLILPATKIEIVWDLSQIIFKRKELWGEKLNIRA